MDWLKLLFKALLIILLLQAPMLVIDHFFFKSSAKSKGRLIGKKEQANIEKEYELLNNNNLILPEEIKKEAFIALKYFPELQSKKIHFLIKSSSFPLASRPAVLPLLIPFLERRYHIIISNETPEALKPIMYKNLPLDARIGVLGHELAHTIYYQKRSNLEIIYTGFLYLNKNFRKKFERATDIETIQRGLGKELYQWSVFLQDVKANNPEIIKSGFIFEDRYLLPEEIKQLLLRKEKKMKN